MNSKEFFFSILPETGWYCAAEFVQLDNRKPFFVHTFFNDKEELYSFLLTMDRADKTMYFAQAAFTEEAKRNRDYNRQLPRTATKEERKEERAQVLTASLKAFWFDIDCGPTKPFATQDEGLAALNKFISDNNIPLPSIVSSGNGLYAYWVLTKAISPVQWKPIAENLKQLASSSGFNVDSGITADSARVLRPVGTHNRKFEEKDVAIIRIADSVTAEEMRSALPETEFAFDLPIDISFDEFTVGADRTYKKVLADEIASNCQFMAHVKKVKGAVSEPVWYYALGVLNCCTDRDIAIHEWSVGHASYSRQETDRFANQWRDKGLGATTCKQLKSLDPTLCEGCPYMGQVVSPISVSASSVIIEGERCKLPYGFSLTEDGVAFEGKKIYSREIKPVSVGHDYTLGYEVAVFSVNDKFESWRPFRLRTALFNDIKGCLMSIADQGITVQGGDAKKLMVQFLEGYINSLKQAEKRAKFCAQMGWRADANGEHIFVLGDTIYSRDGEEKIGLAGSISDVAKSFTCEGSLEVWSELTKKFNTPDMEPLAFEFLALAFGAPLMIFTGYSGAMISAKGAASGAGKTVSGKWGLSTYGPPKKLELHQNDTQNALVSRLGVCNTLPVYIDEITEMAPEALSNLVYRITDGRDKHSLTSRREERSGASWCTLAVVTANNGVVDKLGGFKPDASAQINRVFEYDVPRNHNLTVAFWDEVVPVFMSNYGHAGVEYARYLAAHQDEHKKQIQAYISLIHSKVGANPEERFWVAILAATFYGATIAKSLNLVRFDISPTVTWALKQIANMRSQKTNTTVDVVSLLASYLGDNLNSVLAVEGAEKITTILRDPTRGITGRYEKATGLLWMSHSAMKNCFKIYGYSRAVAELEALGVLVSTNSRKVLGGGTKYGLGLGRTRCWEMKVDNSWIQLEEKPC